MMFGCVGGVVVVNGRDVGCGFGAFLLFRCTSIAIDEVICFCRVAMAVVRA